MSIFLVSMSFKILAAIWRAFVLAKLWVWFLVPMWNLPAISKSQAYALVLIVGVAHQLPFPKSDDSESEWERVGMATLESLLVPAFSLLIGWIIRGWM